MGISIEEYDKKLNFLPEKAEELKALILGKVPNKGIEKALNKSVKPYGFEVELDDNENIIDLKLISSKSRDEDILLDALPNFVSNGSFFEIAMESDETGQLVIRWEFIQDDVKYSEFSVELDEDDNEISRTLLPEDDDEDDFDLEWFLGDNIIKCRSHLITLQNAFNSEIKGFELDLVSSLELAFLELKKDKDIIAKVGSINTEKKGVRRYFLHGEHDENPILDKANSACQIDIFEHTDMNNMTNILKVISGIQC